MTSSTQALYEHHHASNRSEGFSILKDERGKYFRDAVGTGKRVLDIGCRDGALTEAFLEGNEVLGVDVDAIALERAAKRGIRTKHMDLMGDWRELEGEKFEVIVAGEILEHLFYPDTVMQKVSEHLVSGGVFVGSVPNAFSLKNRIRFLMGTRAGTPLADPTHITQFSAHELAYMLGQTFAAVNIEGLGRYRRLAAYSPNWFAFDLVFNATT